MDNFVYLSHNFVVKCDAKHPRLPELRCIRDKRFRHIHMGILEHPSTLKEIVMWDSEFEYAVSTDKTIPLENILENLKGE